MIDVFPYYYNMNPSHTRCLFLSFFTNNTISFLINLQHRSKELPLPKAPEHETPHLERQSTFQATMAPENRRALIASALVPVRGIIKSKVVSSINISHTHVFMICTHAIAFSISRF